MDNLTEHDQNQMRRGYRKYKVDKKLKGETHQQPYYQKKGVGFFFEKKNSKASL